MIVHGEDMVVHVTRLDDYGVNLTVYSGRITLEDALAHYRSLPASHAINPRWISYFDPSADLSELSVAAFPEMKRALGAKLVEIYGDRPVKAAMVCDSRLNHPIISMWRSFLSGGAGQPAAPGLFSSLKAACEWLGLPEAARDALAAAVAGPAPQPQRLSLAG